ncbi:hypothetical protein OsJ_27369 [Oryza sativa Japonica Group]|uniref:Uncharacterized protein n=1 Tax=Oryza sativa subsp. japonica TaxID=39947 RepID=B9G0Z5_ORYSJ|nr:hypothetical protein OsJ_27369 [Oryza sativa Japonica Group]
MHLCRCMWRNTDPACTPICQMCMRINQENAPSHNTVPSTFKDLSKKCPDVH